MTDDSPAVQQTAQEQSESGGEHGGHRGGSSAWNSKYSLKEVLLTKGDTTKWTSDGAGVS
jgi:hypothetical protein